MARGAERDAGLPRIMMIDDELSNLQIVKIIMMRENFQSDLLLYEDARAALEEVRRQPVDLILLDLAMPDMDGFEFMARLKEDRATAEIPVIFLSAFQETEYILKAFEMGATDFIGKPIISPILTARIRHIIQTRTLQNELRHRNEELLNTNRLKDELLSVCSHDLRSPLNVIDLICQFLRDAIAGDARQSEPELVNRIVAQSRLARRLVENLLDLNRIEEGRLVPAPAFFAVEELVRGCHDDELPTLQARGLESELRLPGEPLVGWGDREMLAQVLHNVLNNATRYAQTRVLLEAALAGHQPETGGRLAIRVSDDGPGIPADKRHAVFDKYAKLEHQRGGSGLGLYIARQMVELHRGRIEVESAPAGGTRFLIDLPNVFRPAELPELGAWHERRVLVASPSRVTAQTLESVLVEAGLIDVELVQDADGIPRALDERPPHLVVADAEGGALLAQLGEALRARQLACPWILHGDAAPGGEREPAAGRADAHLPGPFNPLALLRAAHRLLGGEETAGRRASV